MTQTSKTIFEKFQVRKTKKQKSKFINFLKIQFPNAYIECGRSKSNRNIVIGNVSKADILLTAHYDTCAAMPIPNFIMPKNIPLSILYSILMVVPMVLLAGVVEVLVMRYTGIWLLGLMSYIAVFLFCMYMMMLGIANKHTANDNTSGVIQLCEIMESLSDEEKEKVAFVFFDNEEKGLLGSRLFKKMHKNDIKDKLMINFDCVSDGDNIMLVLNKKACKEKVDIISQCFESTEEKVVLIEKSSTTMYPSDQMGFPYGVGVAALRENKVGYYMTRIHTPWDTVFDERNIELLRDCTVKLVKEYKAQDEA